MLGALIRMDDIFSRMPAKLLTLIFLAHYLSHSPLLVEAVRKNYLLVTSTP
jgi:hypothetical protein